MNFRRKYHRSGWENKILDMKSTKCHIYMCSFQVIFSWSLLRCSLIDKRSPSMKTVTRDVPIVIYWNLTYWGQWRVTCLLMSQHLQLLLYIEFHRCGVDTIEFESVHFYIFFFIQDPKVCPSSDFALKVFQYL